MSLILDGTNGVSDIDGSASTPAIRGTHTNTGIFFPAADTIAFGEGGAEVARFNSSGNLGIGTTTPGAKLQVTSGGSNSPGSNLSGNLGQFTSSGGIAYITFGNGDSANQHRYIGAASAIQVFGKVTDAGTATEQARITSGGEFCVNATSSALSTTFYVAGSIGAQQLYGPMFVSNENNTDNVGRGSFNFQRGGVLVGQIGTTNSTCSYTSVSDYRLKENIAPITDALGKVTQLKPCTWSWKSNGTAGQGFIAHELQAAVPDCVTGEKDAVDADGNPVYQGVDTSFLVATLTAAIQELKAELDTTKARLAALEGA